MPSNIVPQWDEMSSTAPQQKPGAGSCESHAVELISSKLWKDLYAGKRMTVYLSQLDGDMLNMLNQVF